MRFIGVLLLTLVALGVYAAAGAGGAAASTVCTDAPTASCDDLTGTITVPAGFDVEKVRVGVSSRSGHTDCVKPGPDGSFTLSAQVDDGTRHRNNIHVMTHYADWWPLLGCEDARPDPDSDDQNLVEPYAVKVGPGTWSVDLAEGAIAEVHVGRPDGGPFAAVDDGAFCVAALSPTGFELGSAPVVAGLARIERLPASQVAIHAYACPTPPPLLDGWIASVDLTAGVPTTATVRLEAARTISLLLRNAAGDPVEALCATATRSPSSPSSAVGSDPDFGDLPPALLYDLSGTSGYAMSSSSGPANVELTGLRPGVYDVHVDNCGPGGPNVKPFDIVGVDVTAGDSAVVSRTVAAGGAVSGTITLPATGVYPVLMGEDICVTVETFPARADGADFITDIAQSHDPDDRDPITYRIDGLRGGTYRVSARPCDGSMSSGGVARTGVAVAAGATTSGVDLTLPKGSPITGAVRLAGGALPEPVCVDALRTSYSDIGGAEGFAMSAGDPLIDGDPAKGTFATNALPPGTYEVLAYDCYAYNDPAGTGLIAAPKTVTVTAADAAAGRAVSAGTFTFAQGAAVGGEVVGADGAPAEKVCVSAEAVDGAGATGDYGSAITDGAGSFTITGLSTGAAATRGFRLRFDDCSAQPASGPQWHGGALYAAASTTVTLTRGTLELLAGPEELAPSGSISGAVSLPSGGPAAGVCVAAFAAAQPTTSAQEPVASAVTAADGSYALPRLHPADGGDYPGAYRVYAAPCGLAARDFRGTWLVEGSAAGSATAAGASSVDVGAYGEVAGADIALAAAAAPATCNPMLFAGGDCGDPIAATAPPLPARADVDAVDVSPPMSPVEVLVDPATVSIAAEATVDDLSPLDMATPGAPVTAAGAADALSSYISIGIDQSGIGDTGGSWNPPMRIDVPVPATAAGLDDDELLVFFDTAESTSWTPIPYIGNRGASATELLERDQDGYYVTGVGADRVVHILTRHATTFGLFGPAGSGTRIPDKPKAQTLKAKPPKRLKHGKTARLARVTDQGRPLAWTSTTKRICTVKRTFKGKGAKRRAIWTLRATKRKGACRLTATAPAKGLALATSFAFRVTIF